MKKSALIFGAGGQDGHYLRKVLESSGVDVVPFNRDQCDVSDRHLVEAVIVNTQPDYIFHLAAWSSTKHEALHHNQDAICQGTINILESVNLYLRDAVVFLSGSALQFRNIGEPIRETDPFRDSSAYAAQRNAMVHMARYYRDHCGIKVKIGYFFHHDSPRRGPDHIAMKVANAAARIGQGSTELLSIDNLEFTKEWTFAGDAMEAVWALCNSSLSESVIGSGDAYSVRQWVMQCFREAGINNGMEHIICPEKGKEFIKVVSDPTTIKSVGWTPSVTFQELARMMVSDATLRYRGLPRP